MAKQVLNNGETGLVIRTKINENFTELYAIGTIVEKADSFIFALTEASDFIKCTKGTAMTATVPPNTDVAFVIGTEIEITQYGAGTVTFAEGSGVTINSPGSNLVINGQYIIVKLKKIGTDEWLLSGDLTT